MATLESPTAVLPERRPLPSRAALGAYAPAAVIGASFVPMLVLHARELWSRPHYQFFPAVLVGSAALVWQSCRGLGALRPGRPSVSWALAGAGWAMLVVALAFLSPPLAAVAALTTLPAAVYALGGWPLLRAALPAWGMLWLLITPPKQLDFTLIAKLQTVVSHWTSRLLDVLGIYHLMDGNIVEVNGRPFLVDQACSGISSLLVVIIGTLFYTFWYRLTPLRGALLMLTAVFWVLYGNVVRILTVVIVSSQTGLDLTSGWKHTALGLLIFVLMMAMVLSTDHLSAFLAAASGAAWRSLRFRKRRASGASKSKPGLALKLGGGSSRSSRRSSSSRSSRPSSSPRSPAGPVAESPAAFAPVETPDASVAPPETPDGAEPGALESPGDANAGSTPFPAFPPLEPPDERGRHREPVDPTVLPDVRRTWVGSKAAALAFGLLLLPGFAMPGVRWHDVLITHNPYVGRFEALGEDAMPERIGPFVRTDFKTETRESNNSWGEFSRTWQYRGQGRVVSVSLDYQFIEWHELTVCYTGTGWKLDARMPHPDHEAASGPWVEAQLANLQGAQGYLRYGLYDHRGRALTPVDSRGTVESLKGRLESWVRVAKEGASDGQPLTYQLQVFALGDRQPTEAERRPLADLYEAFRTTVLSRGLQAGGGK